MVDESNTERIAELIEAVKTKNASKKEVTVEKKKGKGCLTVVIIVVVLAIIGFIVNSGSNDSIQKANAPEMTRVEKIPIVVTSDQLIADLRENALKASNTYKGAYVEVTGKLNNIDSSGDYFTISEINNKYSFDSIMCYVKEEHVQTVSNFKTDQKVTVVGTIKSVGEVLGYSLDVDYIK